MNKSIIERAIEEAIKCHMEHDCCATFNKIENINAAKLEIPENVLAKKDKRNYIYEIDDGTVNIYINSIKEPYIKCPEYTCRPLVAMDILARMTNMGFSPVLLKINNEPVTPQEEFMPTRHAADLLDAPKSNIDLEDKLYKALIKYISTGSFDLVTKEIDEGFSIIANYYNGDIDE